MSTVNTSLREPLPADFVALVQRFPPSAIHDAVAYESTMEVVNALVRLPDLSDGQARYLDTLNVLAERYDRETHPIDTSDLTGCDLLRFAVESSGITSSDLAAVLGVEVGDVATILSGRRRLTGGQARAAGQRFKVDPRLFAA